MRTIAGIATLIAIGITGVADAQSARAELKDANGGTYAFHIHAIGKCEPPFESAGGHFNPGGKQHGKDNPQGAHAGDLPNIEVPANGQVKVEATAKGVSLGAATNGLLDADGSALVVHEGADDYKSDPAGNAGKRIACGVIQAAR